MDRFGDVQIIQNVDLQYSKKDDVSILCLTVVKEILTTDYVL